MSERIHTYADKVQAPDGRVYTVHVLGRQRSDGTWEGSLLFEPLDGSGSLVTGVETTQPSRQTLDYWASGLETTYRLGALQRTRADPPSPNPPVDVDPATPPVAPRMRAVLDPFQVYVQGEAILRQELGALSAGHLKNILSAYALAPDGVLPATEDRETLVEAIVAAVRGRLAQG
jgi:hypothetical protein